MSSPAATETHAPRFMETVDAALSVAEQGSRAAAEIVVAARRRLQAASDRLLAAKDREEMHAVLAEEMPDMELAVHVVGMGIRMMSGRGSTSPSSRINLLERLRSRGTSDDVVERIRLGLLAADDEAALLRFLPGGLEAHPTLWKEDARGRFLLMTITKWMGSDAAEPPIWEDLTYAFLDSAGRAFGLASAEVNDLAPDWASKVA